MIPTRESAVLSILTRLMMTGLKQCEPSNDEQDRITISPKANATYLEPWGPSPKWITRIKMGTADATSVEGQVA